jgi:hypothetical protein
MTPVAKLPPVSTTPAENLPPVLTKPAENFFYLPPVTPMVHLELRISL